MRDPAAWDSFLLKMKPPGRNRFTRETGMRLLQPLEEFDLKQEQYDQDEHDEVHPSEGDVPPELPPVVLIFLLAEQITTLAKTN